MSVVVFWMFSLALVAGFLFLLWVDSDGGLK